MATRRSAQFIANPDTTMGTGGDSGRGNSACQTQPDNAILRSTRASRLHPSRAEMPHPRFLPLAVAWARPEKAGGLPPAEAGGRLSERLVELDVFQLRLCRQRFAVEYLIT